MHRNSREDDQRVAKRQRLLLESLLGVAHRLPESNALESAIATLEKRRAHCIRELQRQKEILKELDDQIHELRNTDRQDVTMTIAQDNSLLQLPYDVVLYILEFFDLPNYRPFYGSFSSTECIKLFFGFFKSDKQRTVHLMFPCVCMVNYNSPAQGRAMTMKLCQNVPHTALAIDTTDNEFISYQNIETFTSLTSLNLSYSSTSGEDVLKMLGSALQLRKLDISYPLNQQHLKYNTKTIDQMTSLTSLSCLSYGHFNSIELNYALQKLTNLREMRICVAQESNSFLNQLERHPNLRSLHLCGQDDTVYSLKLPPTLTALTLEKYVIDEASSSIILTSNQVQDLHISLLSENSIRLLSKNTSLTSLTITASDSVCQNISNHPALQHLSLKDKHISRSTLLKTILDPSNLLLSKLVTLELSNVKFDEKCARRCIHAKSLRSLKLKHSEFCTEAARVLWRSVHSLTELAFRRCTNITDEVAICLLQHPTIQSLNLGMTGISDEIVPFVIVNRILTRLTMYAHLSAKSISKILEHNKTLTALSINGSPIQESDLHGLETNTSIREIHLAMDNDMWGYILSSRPGIVCAGAMSE